MINTLENIIKSIACLYRSKPSAYFTIVVKSASFYLWPWFVGRIMLYDYSDPRDFEHII